MNISSYHVPVLLEEVMAALQVQPGKTYIDATLGGGGHTGEILKRGGRVIGIDQDEDAIAYVEEKFKIFPACAGRNLKFEKHLVVERGNFSEIKEIVARHPGVEIAGVLFDLGMSSYQIDQSGRGFSFNKDEPLDMRMDNRQSVTAAEIVNKKSREGLYEIFSKYAEEIHSRAISDVIIRARAVAPLRRTGDLARAIRQVIPDERQARGTMARIFQALRIVVNEEIERLVTALCGAIEVVAPGGRIAVLSYHSLEDREVKLTFKTYEREHRIRTITRHPLVASEEERQRNPRSKAAKLRVAEKL